MNNWLSRFAALTCMLLLTACATEPRGAAKADPQMATCHVCRYNNDLACVEFRKKESTPTAQYGGETYCFCSGSCETAFAKNPAKYVPAGSR